MDESLREYREKRAFDKTPEPAAAVPEARQGPLLFSIQLHDATRLHWDLRLELDGVLKSWAVPKGPSYDPAEKRFAVATEDHPFDYAPFEGSIPEGSYGAGEMIVWDCGTYWCDEFDPNPPTDREAAQATIRQELAKGKVSLFFRGTRLKGSWALVKMKDDAGWLFFKHNDEFARPDFEVLDDLSSVLTGRTLEDVKRKIGDRRVFASTELGPHGAPEEFPPKVGPMLAALSDAVFDHPDWIFEPKLDGVRALAFLEGGAVRLVSRNGLDLTRQFPDLAKRLSAQRAGTLVLDGEIMAFGPDGRATFHAMQQRLNLADETMLQRADVEYPTAFYVFDVLHADGHDLRPLPLTERKRLLAQVLLPDPRIQATATLAGEGRALYNAVIHSGFEGVVAKRADSRYESGKRSKNWLKIKATQTAEFVVGGLTPGEGSRSSTFGALMLGFSGEKGLTYVGNVGSGFDEATLEALSARLEALKTDICPFDAPPPRVDGSAWLKPEVVVEVKYAEMTPAGSLRAPVFLRVRDDADPSQAGVPAVVEAPGEGNVSAADTELDQDIARFCEALDAAKTNATLPVGRHELSVTNLDKVLWPAHGELAAATKRDLLRYLAQVSPQMLPHLRDRPLTMIRFPEGIHGEKFFQKHWDQRKPEFVETMRLYSDHTVKDQEYLLPNNLATILWLGQLGTLEFHVPAARYVAGPDGEGLGTVFTGSLETMEKSLLNFPDFIEFDIDPYVYSGQEAPGDEPEYHEEGFEKGKTVAFWLRALLSDIGMEAFVKTTGKTGLHIFAPIVRNLDFDAVRSICEMLSRSLEGQHPKEITTEWSVPKRTGKIFMDYNMNVRMKTLGSVLTPRATLTQGVSMPLTWEELRDAYPTQFTLRSAPQHLRTRPDPWARILEAKVDLAGLLG